MLALQIYCIGHFVVMLPENKGLSKRAHIDAGLHKDIVIGRFPVVPQNKGLLWRAHLESGASIGVYTVGLDTPLRLVINLDFCRCVLSNVGAKRRGRKKGVPGGGERVLVVRRETLPS